MFITTEDQDWLEQNFFKNRFLFNEENDGYKIEGKFSFSAYFDEDKQGYYLKPDKSYIKDSKFFINDEYEISLYIPKINTIEDNFYRHVKETEGRIKEMAKKLRNGKNEELHINPNETLCIIGLFQEIYDIDIKTFIKSTLLQFFYDQSFFTVHEKWVRGEYSHGLKGILESYLDACFNARNDKKLKMTKILIEKINLSEEKQLSEEIKKILENPNFIELIIHSKYIQGIFLLKKMLKKNKFTL